MRRRPPLKDKGTAPRKRDRCGPGSSLEVAVPSRHQGQSSDLSYEEQCRLSREPAVSRKPPPSGRVPRQRRHPGTHGNRAFGSAATPGTTATGPSAGWQPSPSPTPSSCSGGWRTLLLRLGLPT
ncbi:hypothetical protein CB1_000880006 [Camelus ferus]|nr:hypothetical protein CB1_000880006 [Camelus ferus]